jgi:hypothetical protein
MEVTMVRLRYIGPRDVVDGVLPLPEGWPAADHDEPDEALAEAKLARGLTRAARRRRTTMDDEEVSDAGD